MLPTETNPILDPIFIPVMGIIIALVAGYARRLHLRDKKRRYLASRGVAFLSQQVVERDIEAFNRALRKEPGAVQVIKVTRPGTIRFITTQSSFIEQQINGETSPRIDLYGLAVFEQEIRLYVDVKREPVYEPIPVDAILWYGRPKKYRNGFNEMLIHAESKAGWFSYRIFIDRTDMIQFVRGLKAVTSQALQTAYRRRRPYVHYGPVEVCPAQQDIYGAWLVDAPRTAYLTPLQLVVLNAQQIEQLIPLESVQEIRAGQRLDAPEADGIVQFKSGDEKLAFTLPGFNQFAESLGEAAKRSLEAPIQRKGKHKDDEEEWE